MKVTKQLRDYLRKLNKNVTKYNDYEKRLISFEKETEGKKWEDYSEDEKQINISFWKEFNKLEEERVILKKERFKIVKNEKLRKK